MSLPEPFARQFWSYSGVTPEIRIEIEQILRGDVKCREQESQENYLTRCNGDSKSNPEEFPIKQLPNGIWVLCNDSHISKWVEEKGQLQHDFHTLPAVLEEIPVGGLVVDIGASIGDSTAPFLERVGDNGQVIAFEPNLDAFECLKRNCPEAVCSQQALGRADGSSGLHIPQNSGAAYICNEGEQYVEIRTLDSFELSRCDLIKIDVEGFETRVLKGAEQTIAKFRPKLLIEVNEGALKRQGTSSKELFDWLRDHDYEWRPVQELHIPDPPQYDVICRPMNLSGDVTTPGSETYKVQALAATEANESDSCRSALPAQTNSVSTGSKLVVPWANRDESIAYIDKVAADLLRFCTAPRSTLVVRERLRKIRVITKVR